MELKRKRRNKKRYVVIKLLLAVYCLIILSSKYGTYAWLTSKTSAEGTIKNATTSDLFKVTYGDVEYLKNCKVKTSITITNISDMEIPIKLTNVFGIPFNTNSLEPGKSIKSNFNGRAPSGCEGNSLTYHLTGFPGGYIDEDLSIPLDHQKMNVTIQQNVADNKEKAATSTKKNPQPEASKENDQPEKTATNEENPAQNSEKTDAVQGDQSTNTETDDATNTGSKVKNENKPSDSQDQIEAITNTDSTKEDAS
ncbi:hypothetical protein [Bacillus sp. NEB1478]|uniref:hypothetical protein n=1 Tax=Bacillus sp. NEB1478 TaxID=3073816 RepID=UPI002873C9ED|nr:hypothetical protein [Bacillus sp. NEB1478]WNB92486.1 hypothetical protein RGB74_02135 [Bacillus sp. NEB1478]